MAPKVILATVLGFLASRAGAQALTAPTVEPSQALAGLSRLSLFNGLPLVPLPAPAPIAAPGLRLVRGPSPAPAPESDPVLTPVLSTDTSGAVSSKAAASASATTVKAPGAVALSVEATPNVSVQQMTAISVAQPVKSAAADEDEEAASCSVAKILKDSKLTTTAEVFALLNATVPEGSTLFAPSDDAWTALLKTLDLSLWASLESDPSLLATLLEGHVLPEVVYLDHMTDGSAYDTVLPKEEVTVSRSIVYQTTKPYKGYNIKVVGSSDVEKPAQITKGDIVNKCGVLHVIDRVLVSKTAAKLPVPIEKQVEVISISAPGTKAEAAVSGQVVHVTAP